MSICSTINWIGKYIDFTLNGYEYSKIESNKYDLNEVFFYSTMCIFVTITLTWWMIPVRIILHTISNAFHTDEILFRCKKK